jgi:hypothetical protein
MIAGPGEKTSQSVRNTGKRGKNPRSLQALEPTKWKPGQSGNPNGRPNAGAAVRDYWNEFYRLSVAELLAIFEDESQPVAKRAAARVWLDSMKDSSELSMILDRTNGKAIAQVDVTSNGESVNLAPIVLDGDREL